MSNSNPDPGGLSLRARKKQQARERILSAARQLIAANGYEQTRMRDIAARAELSYQTLYNYFPTKGQILAALLYEQAEDMSSQLEVILNAYAGALLDSLDQLNQLSFQLAASGDRELWRVVTVELFRANSEFDQVYRLADRLIHDCLQRLLLDARNAGELSAGVSLEQLADTLYDLADVSLLRFILNPTVTEEAALKALSGRIRLVLSPYVTPVQAAAEPPAPLH